MTDIMPLNPSWAEIIMRLVLTVATGSLIGINREVGGHAAGFRTTVLVGLAACLAMIQANLMLPVGGKTEHSFAVMDTLRFPLGILTGVGFIGGGAILKRGDLITGVTTAATLWIMTAIGLCIGGGQVIVGCTGAIIAFMLLSPMKMLDDRLPRRRKARLVVVCEETAAEVEVKLATMEVQAHFVSIQRSSTDGTMLATFELSWRRSFKAGGQTLFIQLQEQFRIESFEILGFEA